jgi:hypothetical protein
VTEDASDLHADVAREWDVRAALASLSREVVDMAVRGMTKTVYQDGRRFALADDTGRWTCPLRETTRINDESHATPIEGATVDVGGKTGANDKRGPEDSGGENVDTRDLRVVR